MSRGYGYWQYKILEELSTDRRGCFALVEKLARRIGRSLTRAESSAARRAARKLERAGDCQATLEWSGTPPRLVLVVRVHSASELPDAATAKKRAVKCQ